MVSPLDESILKTHPLKVFDSWYREWLKTTKTPEPTAVVLATSSLEGAPSARVVLLKEHDLEGFIFYTNYESRKGSELELNPRAALVFYWGELRRQVRVEGAVERVDKDISDAYFSSREYMSQIGAWASKQSRPLSGRAELEKRVVDLKNKFPEGKVPRPPHWGGYKVVPDKVEFWQGAENRLHDRFQFVLEGGKWSGMRLNP